MKDCHKEPSLIFCFLGTSQVREAKGRGRPYTIVFVGVNGVGKSTNLAKVAYWLLQNDVSVRARLGNLSVAFAHRLLQDAVMVRAL